MRANIIKSLMENPKNANKLCKDLGVNYRTVEHHLKILESNDLLVSQGNGYGRTYFLSSLLSKNIDTALDVINSSGPRKGKHGNGEP